MPDKVYISNRLRNLIVGFLAIFFIGFCAWNLISARNWIGRPFPGFFLMKNNLVPILWLPEWEGFKRGIKFGDAVVAVNGQPVSIADDVDRIVLQTDPGEILNFSVIRGKQTLQFEVPVSVFTLRDYLICFVILVLLGLSIFFTGIIVFYLKPNNPASWCFLLFGMAFGLFTCSDPDTCANHYLVFPFQMGISLVGPASLLLGLYFPLEIKSRRYFIYFLACSMPFLVFFRIYFFHKVFTYILVDTIGVVYLIVTCFTGIIIIIRSFATSSDPRIRQQGKVIIYGGGLGLVMGSIVVIGSLVFRIISGLWFTLPGFIFPFIIGYAIVKHNLFDVDIVIRRSAGYLFASGITVVLFFALIGLFSLILQQITGQSSQIAAVLSTIFMMILFRPLRERIDRGIDRRFFREKYEYTATIQKASQVLVSIIDLHRLLNQILSTVVDAIKIERGMILLREQEPDRFPVWAARGYPNPEILEPIGAEHHLVQHLEAKLRPIQLNDVQELEEFREHQEPILRLAAASGLVLVIPIGYERRLIGILALGPKKSGAWYSSEDMELLSTLMMQTAVSIENARKIVELKKVVELEARLQEMKQVDEMKDNFLSMVSHDLRTPMTSIKGYTSLMLEKLGRLDLDRQRQYLTTIHRESDRLTRLITNLLEIQRFEAGRGKLMLAELDLAELVGESVTAFQGAALTKQIQLEHTLLEGPVLVDGDRDRLSQVMANLLSNAIKFTPESGRVKVSLEQEMDHGKAWVKVLVSDTGPGIPPDLQAKIFDKFQQANQLVRSKEQGSGLGLALVREIVSQHGGEVGLESEAGRGSAFRFRLPVLKQEAGA